MSEPEQCRDGLPERRDFPPQAGVAAPERDAAHTRSSVRMRARHEGARMNDAIFPLDGGEMGERIRAQDWSVTPLGPVEDWPGCLRAALDMLLRSPVPMSLSWGKRGIFFYNDALIPVLGARHPQALGIAARDVWPEHAEWTDSVLRQVLSGESMSLHNQRLETRRSGMREQTWFDLDYSPIVDAEGKPQGMLGVVAETTTQIAALRHREKLEANLREGEARQRFVVAFNDRVRRLADPQAVMAEAVAALGAQLEASRCGYAEIGSNMQTIDVKAEWADAAQESALGERSMANASDAVRATFLAGKTFVMRDADQDSRESVRARASNYLAWGSRAVIAAPLIHNGRWVALLYVADAQAREWTSAEIALTEEMAARIWEAVERARAEASLRENEARLRGLFETVPAAVVVYDRDGVIQDYNPRAAELWGRTPIRGVDKRGAARLWWANGDELPPGHSVAAEVLRSGEAWHGIEMTIMRPNGARMSVQVDSSLLTDARGEVTGAIVAFNNIDTRKRREANLALLADIAEATARCDGEAQIMRAVSERTAAHLHLHCCCLIGIDEPRDLATIEQVWYQGEIPKLPGRASLSNFVIPAFNAEARAGKPLVVRDCHADPRTDGDAYARYEVASFISLPWYREGVWRGLLAFCDDAPREWREDEVELLCEVANRILPRIERARAQAALREANEHGDSERRLYEAILDNTPDLAYIFDLDHRFTYANRILLKMWGKSADEALGKTCLELGYPEWHAAMHDREIEQVIASKLPIRGQVPFAGTFGERIYDYIFMPVIGPDGKVEAIAGTTRDITEQRENEQHLRKSETALRESEAELAAELADTQLLQTISAELVSETHPDALYARIVEAASAIMHSDCASLQMLYPERGHAGELLLVAHRGFSAEAAQHWEWVRTDSNTSCGIALRERRRVMVSDVRESAAIKDADEREAYRNAGIVAMQTTPLFARSGKLVGMLSTHWSEPQEPSARRVGLFEVLARQAADLMENRRSEMKLVELNAFLERRVSQRTEELTASERELRRMASQLTMAEHAERRRISQILHDDLQQQLHSIQMKLATARGALARGEEAKALRHLSDAEQWSGEGVETARRLTVDLSPPILKSEGLAEALEWLVTQMREMHGLHVEVSGDRDLKMHDDAKRVLIYQIVRELLFNIVKHAGTDSARIELRRHDDMLDVCVLDAGKGFELDKLRHMKPRSAGGFGLTSAQERLHLMGGGIEMDSAPGIGTSIVLHVPIRADGGDAEADERAQGEDTATPDMFG